MTSNSRLCRFSKKKRVSICLAAYGMRFKLK